MGILSRKKIVISAGPLLRFTPEQLPEWLLRSGVGFEKMRELAYQFVSKVWPVTQGSSSLVCHQRHERLQPVQLQFRADPGNDPGREYGRAGRRQSGRADRGSETALGASTTPRPQQHPSFVYMDMVVQSGTSFDAFALQVRFGKDETGFHLRDMMQISSILDCFAPIAKPLYITDVRSPARTAQASSTPVLPASGIASGIRRIRPSGWSGSIRIALSKPFVEAVNYGSLADSDGGVIAHSGLLNQELEAKESLDVLRNCICP
jgi:hypothetical protein